jgi:hypothetical protein
MYDIFLGKWVTIDKVLFHILSDTNDVISLFHCTGSRNWSHLPTPGRVFLKDLPPGDHESLRPMDPANFLREAQ